MASFIMVMLTPITTAKNATRIARTLVPVSGLGAMVAMANSCELSGRDEIVDGGGDLAEPDVGDVETDRRRSLWIAGCGSGHKQPQFSRLIAPDYDHRSVWRHRIGADDVQRGVDRTIDID